MSEAPSQFALGSELWATATRAWRPEVDDTLVCCHMRNETHDVKTFTFRTREPRLFRFRPGQFITLEVDIDGETINRCYTIASSPTRPDSLSITVKRHPTGRVSNWLHDNLRPGTSLKVLGPAGDFTCAEHPSQKYLFLSGGSGITPLMSMARAHHDLGAGNDIIFVHSARTPQDIIFRHELAAMTQETFRAAYVCERTGDDPAYTGPIGFLDLNRLTAIAPDFKFREIFCCGPAPYMTAVKQMLAGAGFDMTHYHEESFTFGEGADIATVLATEAPATAGTFKIEFTKSGQIVSCGPDQFILDAAKAAGLRLPFSCSKGLCGTCKSKKLSGEVNMKHGGGIRQREIDQGMILICCSKPLSDVKLEK